MPAHNKPGPAKTLRSWIVGQEIRHIMNAAQLTHRALAKALDWDGSKLSRLINGQRRVSAADLTHLLIACNHTNRLDRDRLLALAANDRAPQFWHDDDNTDLFTTTIADLEHDSTAITYYAPTTLPDILHTPEYHHHFLTTSPLIPAHTVQARTTIYESRRALLTRYNPPTFTFVIGHPATCGTPKHLVNDQISYLRALSKKSHITIHALTHQRILALYATSPFQLLDTACRGKIVHIPLHTSSLYLEQPHIIATYQSLITHYLTQISGPHHSLNNSAVSPPETRKLA
ncbi:Scr1 family TA system antitoxin-like transcriptional regulator [Actinokineospora inagensis]|uniref:Scr1 family TA system antitoxin-like transcriptional regulator n=1 Tax=Actinokineospora inagensis TaxID=103730 RepID=UPI000419F36C|nr:Scr1 family TA system antitoxin-like transcriptional regulator [Actinokineospora inagensis]